MSNFSDHKKPQTSIFDLLPEVFRSDVNKSVSTTALDRHLTKDDTTRITGFIGESNAQAVVDRRIKEETPHRQAFQLAPTMVSSTGVENNALSFKAFMAQLELMGVDPNRLPNWGNTLQFNWVPPINIDMLVNYQDYFWKSSDPTALPQYLTIENSCNKARSKVASYANVIAQRGSSFSVKRINHATSELVIDYQYDDLFVPGFVFYTKDVTAIPPLVGVNMQDKFWTVVSSAFDSTAGETTIKVQNTSTQGPLVNVGSTNPTAGDFEGEWFFNTTNNRLYGWLYNTMSLVWEWTPITTSMLLNISLTERLQVFQAQANCACNQDFGWDIAQWDDNPTLWNTTLLATITHPTEAAWVIANGTPVANALWHDTSTDELKQYNGTTWNTVTANFSAITAQTTGVSLWDMNTTCGVQTYNQWTNGNKWVHKSEITSSSGAQRAKLPILEYDSTLELNEWVRATYAWKYRSNTDQAFEKVTSAPTRLELEPIKGYYVEYFNGEWVMYLFHTKSTMCRDVDYTNTFVPGYKFRITDDLLNANVYTVKTAEYREITAGYIATRSSPATLQANVGVDIMCTVVTLSEDVFNSPQVAHGQPDDPINTRIEPITTAVGDGWRGYHAHWVLDDESIVFEPTTHQRWNYYRQRSFDTAVAQAPDASFSAKMVGIAHIEYTTKTADVTDVDLPLTLQYSPTTPQMFAVPNSNEIRVYVNDVRQYGTYVEKTASGTPNYTLIGTTAYTTQQIEYVTGVKFNQPLGLFDVVRIEVGPAPFNCMGNNAIPVRTVEDETEFTLGVVNGTQPVYRSMTQCYQVEQSKTILNQYPLFNIYDVTTSRVITANQTFGFKEDPTALVNTSIQRRIVTSPDGKDFTFEQHLRSATTEEIYAYRAIRPVATYWYSPALNQTANWNGYAWSDRVVVNTSTGPVVRRITTSSTAPQPSVEYALWFDTTARALRQYVEIDTINHVWGWSPITDVVINNSDPLLRSIWRHGLNNEQYTPSYVNAELTPVTPGDPTGDWEAVDQWIYNSEHKNYKEVTYAQMVTHMRSIITNQPKIPGLQSGGVYTLTQSEYNYGLGGTIKEHNDGFDTLISAVNVSNVTPVSVIEFASQEYASSIIRTRDLFNNLVVEYMKTYSKDTFTNFTGEITKRVITAYENNDYAAQLYGDTVAYNAATHTGIQNWIATIPMLGLGNKYQPHISVERGVVHVLHHDGHRSVIEYSAGEQDRFARQLCGTNDNRVPNGKMGVINASLPPATKAAFTTAFGGSDVRTGVYWYQTSGTRTLYRFQAYDVTFTPPPYYDITGQEIPDGVLYYDKGQDVVFVKVGLSWVQHAPIGDISSLWMEVNFAEMFGEILLEIEQRLYDVTPLLQPAFDYTSLLSEPTVFKAANKRRFDDYVAANQITAPLINTTYDPTDAFTWNYVMATFDDPHGVVQTSAVSSWQELYTRVYGTPYPHLEPWVLQGFTDKPTWWDATYADVTGTRRWTTTMWTDVLNGLTPHGVPASPAPTYSYVSVDITTDALLPPYAGSPLNVPPNRSLFTTDVITNKSADYAFGDVGPVEWEWTVSHQYPYDLPIISFVMQPARFMHYTFGPTYTVVDGLQVDMLFKRVYSHEDALFHGDVYNDTEQYLVRGTNQWYVNYNRYAGFDTNAEFRELWVNWNPRMTYQFGGIVDTSSFDVGSKYFDITDQDYEILLVNNGVINDLWADAFEISLLNIPPAVVQYNNQALWKMEIDSLAAINRSITYYGVRHYPTTVDVNTNTFTLNSVAIVGVNVALKKFAVQGDHTYMFDNGTTFGVSSSVGNNGAYTTTSSVYNSSANVTYVTVAEAIPSSAVSGNITVGVVMPWVTGDTVVMSSSKFLPAPLKPDTAYYIIRLTTNTFKLAETPQNAEDGVSVVITSVGDGVSYTSEVESSFNVFGGLGNSAELWFHYAIDRNDVRTFTPPHTVTGMQTMINLLDGYAAFQVDQGVVNNGVDASDFDPLTGRLVDWSLETERFMDWAFGLRQSRVRVNDRYEITANIATSEFTFADMTPHWLSSTPVVLTSTGSLPVPLIAGSAYYMVSTGAPGVFKLSLSANPLDSTAHIDLIAPGGGQLYIALYDVQRAYPRFEVNPYRNNVWIDTPLGVLSDIIEGPYTDIRVQQTIFDQYSRPLTPTQLTAYREDLRSHIAVRPELTNDVDKIYQNDPYNYVHIGGGHFFVEGYEHFLIYNDYTTNGALIYDQFLGLWAKRFNLDYYEKEDYTLRPTLGGYYLIDGRFERNMEGATSDMRVYYDALGLSETSEVAPRARSILGYKGRTTFLDLLNVNAKTQFLFYRGMIQAKGSVNSVKAYINSRRFVDAKLDEFWAWKVAEYGDTGRRVYPEVNIFSEDAIVDDVRLEFLAQSELASDPDVTSAVSKGFKVVSYSTPERWNNFPEQKTEIGTPLFLDAEATSLTVVYASPNTPPVDGNGVSIYGHVDYWYDTTTHTLKYPNGTNAPAGIMSKQQITVDGTPTDVLYFHHGDICDDVRVIRKTIDVAPTLPALDYTTYDYTTSRLEPGTGLGQYTKVNSEIVRICEADVVMTDNRPVMLNIYTLNPARSKISPAKLVDKKMGAVVQQVPLWHPAKGYHSHVAMHNVDLLTTVDPARYNTTLNPDVAVANNWEENFWNDREVGKVWLDTSHLSYLPYYDDKIMPNVNDRLYNWGNLAPWSEVKVYEWVQSTTTPDMWTGSGTPRAQTFYRTRAAAVPATFNYIAGTVEISGYVANDKVVFVVDSTGTLPSGIDASHQYTILATAAPNVYTIMDPQTETTMSFTDNGTNVTVVKSFAVEDWVENKFVTDRITVPVLVEMLGGTWTTPTIPSLTTFTIVWVPTNVNDWRVNGILPSVPVDVYVNGVLIESGVVVTDNTSSFSVTLTSSITLNEHDLIDIVRTVHVLTDAETAFDPDTTDDGTTMIQWKVDHYYSAATKLVHPDDTHSSTSAPYYYFWVEQSPTRIAGDTRMSTSAIAAQLENIPTPHLIVQRPKDAPILLDRYGYDVPPYDTAFSLGDLSEDGYMVPVLYREAIIRGVTDYINDDDRYVVRFTCDHTLRNVVTTTSPMRKNKHQEWKLFRKSQTSTLPRELWDRLTEALVGYKLTNPSVRVPALDRSLYDSSYGTDTQFGLGTDQTFVEKSLGIATILAYLTDPTNDFAPLDINTFFSVYSFDTPANIIQAMDVIYTSFSSEHVNAIWFNVLDDSLSLRAKYKELMKTSWVALHGIRVLEVGGLFDD